MAYPTFATHTNNANEAIDATTVNDLQTAVGSTFLNNYDIAVSAEDILLDSEVILRFICPRALRIPTNLAGSIGSATVAPNATTTITIRKRASGSTSYSNVASFNFTTGTLPRSANLSTQAAVDFAAGDELSIIGPASHDTLLASWAMTLNMVYP